MPVKNLEQGSIEWLNFRKSRIMATDIPIILGSNPWKSKIELWEEKLDIRPPVQLNDAMRRGQELETTARKLASELIGIEFEPVVIESTKYPWLASSLDGIGIGKNQYILEVKCPKEFTHVESTDGNIPIYYMDQIQTQLICSEASICYYFSYRPEYTNKPYAIIEVRPDPEKHQEILHKGYEFYVNMCTMNPPVQWKLKIKE